MNSTINYSTKRTPFSIIYTKEPNYTKYLAILLKLADQDAKTLVNDYTKVIDDVWKCFQ